MQAIFSNMNCDRDDFLQMDDIQLSSVCKITFTKATGPGGQKRNKTSSAVQIHLPEYNLTASDCTERSQNRNRANALRKIRMALAFAYRKSPQMPLANPECSITSAAYPLYTARLLDILQATSYDHKLAAEQISCSPSHLLKKLYRDPELWQFFQKERNQRQLPRLMPPK
jgi:hypothetical protein